jgi:hypothetical protein
MLLVLIGFCAGAFFGITSYAMRLNRLLRSNGPTWSGKFILSHHMGLYDWTKAIEEVDKAERELFAIILMEIIEEKQLSRSPFTKQVIEEVVAGAEMLFDLSRKRRRMLGGKKS